MIRRLFYRGDRCRRCGTAAGLRYGLRLLVCETCLRRLQLVRASVLPP